MRVGIIGAMPEEIASLEKHISAPKRLHRGMREYISGNIGEKAVVVVFSRWGKVAAASTATTLIEQFGVNLLLFTGVAGAVDPQLNIGDIVIGNELIQHDMDASAIPGISRFEIPLLKKTYFEASSEYSNIAAQAADLFLEEDFSLQINATTRERFSILNPKVSRGTIASGDKFVTNSSDLRAGIRNLKCVEMEGAAVAQVAYEHALPFVIIRTISDKADHDASIDFPEFIKSVACGFSCGIALRLLKMMP